MKARDLDAALKVAKQEVEDASRAVTDAYAAEDVKLAHRRRKQLEATEVKVIDLGHQVTAAAQRVERSARRAPSPKSTPGTCSRSASSRPAPSLPN